MEPEIYQPQPDNKIDTFLDEVAQPTTPAMDGPGFTPPPPGESPKPQQPQQQPYTPPAPDADPVFTPDDLGAEQAAQEQEQPQSKQRSNGYKDKVLMGIIRAEDNISSTICAVIAKQEDNTPFRATEQDMQDIRVAMEPFEDWIIDKCPAVLPFLLVYGTVKIKQFQKGRHAMKNNKANRQAAGNTETMNQVHTATQPANVERKNYTIYKDGYYRTNRAGVYMGRSDKANLERPQVKDLDKILSVNSNRTKEILQAAFNWSDADFKRHGITD